MSGPISFARVGTEGSRITAEHLFKTLVEVSGACVVGLLQSGTVTPVEPPGGFNFPILISLRLYEHDADYIWSI